MHATKWSLVLVCAGVLALGGCRSMGGGLPKQVVACYDAGKPDGWMEIEAGRDGRIRAVEVDIPVADLPASIRAAAERELPGGRVTGAELEYTGRAKGYEVKKVVDGREYELVFDEEGALVEKEVSLRRSEVPAGVVEAALAVLPASSFKSVERIEHPGEADVYHVKMLRDGASYKVEVSPEGAVLRSVREAKTEVEIPLR